MTAPYWDHPEFYCHGQQCIDGNCSPMFCADDDSPLAEGDADAS